ncbi:Uncharacterized protein BP5553_04219 [Venustampulla echinocandica]|uniref:DUF7580 domain-containing protein n=1 Tax=Venustampulla echinocandica TaxID=2656787 RepID=A0A370TWI4_9HELO|nr:Uncharacterized protein BP5553_04219 [Venustampulla echinocandica]RDL39879.1 Uncharacterized protein BP5553_04219 [Venustampulla echinocandica]
MSGIEIIGFVLGGLPLVISAAEHYKKGFEPLVRWMRFKFVFRDFITSVDIQRQLFHLVLKKLLIRVQLPPEEKQRLLTVPNYAGWSHPDTVDAMRSRLGESYDACMDILRAMKEDMQELQAMMSLKNGSVDWAHPGEKQWKYQAKRIQLSFSKNGTRTIQSLEKRIQSLKRLLNLLDSTDDEDPHNTKAISKDTTWAKFFECIRRHAVNLHSAIKNGWKCNCEGIHATGLQLQKRAADDWSSQFTMTFGAFALSKNENQNLYSHRRVLIILQESTSRSVPLLQRPKPSPLQGSYLDPLRTDFESRSSSQLTATILPVPPGTNSASSLIPSRFSSFRSNFTKSNSNLTSSSISTSNRTESFIENRYCESMINLNPRPKAKKGARFAMDLLAEPEDTTRTKTPTTSFSQPESLPQMTSPAEESCADVEINDLCSALKDLSPKATRLGYLSDHEKQRHELCCLTEEVADSRSFEVISLEKLLATDGHLRLTRQKRYKVACILASSLLQLQTTPWLSGNLNKSNILFYYHGSEVLIDQPYINHSFSSTKNSNCSSENMTTEDQTHTQPRANLSSFGILLLELCWGQAIESQTNLRKKHLSSDGQAIGGTDFLTAIDWLDTVDEEEPRMSPIIKWCIFGLFDRKLNWADTKFTQAVYINVARPLEMLVMAHF